MVEYRSPVELRACVVTATEAPLADATTVLELLASRPAWHQRAACRGHTDLLFPSRSDWVLYRQAVELCRSCPVVEECRAEGDRIEEGHGDLVIGMRAGESAKQRALRRRRARRSA